MAYEPSQGTPAYRAKTHKVCTTCNKELLISEFYKRKRDDKKLIPTCIHCTKEKHRKYYEAKKEEIIDRVRASQKLRAEEDKRLDEEAIRIGKTAESARAEISKRAIIGRAIWSGAIRLAEACQICGAEEPITPLVQGDWRHLSQTRVVWCCSSCKGGVEQVGLRSQVKRLRAEKAKSEGVS
jgi:hypothetical protein